LCLFFLVVTVVYTVKGAKPKTQQEQENNNNNHIAKQVQTIVLGEHQTADTIETAGNVKAETKVDVISLGSGTIRNIYFDIGDNVFANKLLASLSESSVSTNYNTAKNNYDNIQNNLSATERLANEAITRAELGIITAEESVISAEIALQASQNNFDNTKNLLTFLTSKIIKRFDQGIRIKNLPEVQKIKGKVELVGEDGKTKKVSIADLDKELQDKNKWMYVKILEGDGFINALSRAIVNEPSFFDKDGSPARGRVDDDGRVWVNVKDGSIDAYAFQKPDGADARAKVDSNEQLVVLPFAKDSGGLIRGAADDDGTIRVKIMSEIICTILLFRILT